MYETTFDIVAIGMRYFFLALIVFILLRLVVHSLREFRAVQAAKREARSISPGYLEALAPPELAGEKYVLMRDNTIGCARRCTIRLEAPGVSNVHALIYEKRDGLFITDVGSEKGVLINGERIAKKEELLYTQDVLQFGDFECVLHLAGEEDDGDA